MVALTLALAATAAAAEPGHRPSAKARQLAVMTQGLSNDAQAGERLRDKVMETLRGECEALALISRRLEALTAAYAGTGPLPEPRGPLRGEADEHVQRAANHYTEYGERDDAVRALRGLNLAQRALNSAPGAVDSGDLQEVINPLDFEHWVRDALERVETAIAAEDRAWRSFIQRRTAERRAALVWAAAGAAAALAAAWAYSSRSA